jgi:hypothetical protein
VTQVQYFEIGQKLEHSRELLESTLLEGELLQIGTFTERVRKVGDAVRLTVRTEVVKKKKKNKKKKKKKLYRQIQVGEVEEVAPIVWQRP